MDKKIEEFLSFADFQIYNLTENSFNSYESSYRQKHYSLIVFADSEWERLLHLNGRGSSQ